VCLVTVLKSYEVISYGAECVTAEQDDTVKGDLCSEEKVGVLEIGLDGLLLHHRANKKN
jgi:hypothetical protein